MTSELSPLLAPPWPAPTVGEQVDVALDEAINTLAAARRLTWLGHGPTEIHLLASLHYQLSRRLLDAIELARDQDIPDTDIAHLAGMPLDELRDLFHRPGGPPGQLTTTEYCTPRAPCGRPRCLALVASGSVSLSGHG